MKKQKTIHEKWEDDGITILPPKEIMKQLQDPNKSSEEKADLIEKLYEGIDIVNDEDKK